MKRPLWFIFPGAGSQRQGAGRDLMQIPIFSATIQRAAAVLRPFNIDLVWILTEAPEAVFEDVKNTMVSITAMQVALVDVLRAIGLYPDGIVGTSLGELGAAYTDDTLTLEQTVLTAYWRGRCMMEAKVPVGPKLNLNMTVDQCAKRCPLDLDIVGFNDVSVAVAGPEQSVKNFVDVLASEGICGKIFGTKELLYHTRYVAAAALDLCKHLEMIICNPKPHSPRWISTSLPQDKWESKTENLINAKYFTNNIRAPVNMVTPFRAMPKNAVLVEISANAKLIHYMKPVIPETVVTIELIRKEAPDSAMHLFEAIRKICEATGQPTAVEELSVLFGSAFMKLNGVH